MFKDLGEKYGDYFYLVFRVLVGFSFFTHGAQKLLGWFGGVNGSAVPITLSIPPFGIAGVIEIVCGLLIAFGIFTRLAAFFGAIDMVGAWVFVHIPRGYVPLTNGGEAALLFLTCFLIMLMHGAKKWSMEQKLMGGEKF